MMQFGNFIGDAVKGNSYVDYPQRISDGIQLHRAIDVYTDGHPLVRESVRSLRPRFGRWSAILLDIYFDYLLASRFDEFSGVPLRRFTKRFYFTMIRRRRWLPGRFKRFMWHFICSDRLGKYATKEGVGQSLSIMVKVHPQMDISVGEAVNYLTEHEEEILAVFRIFFNDLQSFCNGYIMAVDRDGYLKEVR